MHTSANIWGRGLITKAINRRRRRLNATSGPRRVPAAAQNVQIISVTYGKFLQHRGIVVSNTDCSYCQYVEIIRLCLISGICVSCACSRRHPVRSFRGICSLKSFTKLFTAQFHPVCGGYGRCSSLQGKEYIYLQMTSTLVASFGR